MGRLCTGGSGNRKERRGNKALIPGHPCIYSIYSMIHFMIQPSKLKCPMHFHSKKRNNAMEPA
jgi:hypothetical protein